MTQDRLTKAIRDAERQERESGFDRAWIADSNATACKGLAPTVYLSYPVSR